MATPKVKTPPRAGIDEGRSVTVAEHVDGDGPGDGLGDGAGDGTGDGEGEGVVPSPPPHAAIASARANGASRESSRRIMVGEMLHGSRQTEARMGSTRLPPRNSNCHLTLVGEERGVCRTRMSTDGTYETATPLQFRNDNCTFVVSRRRARGE